MKKAIKAVLKQTWIGEQIKRFIRDQEQRYHKAKYNPNSTKWGLNTDKREMNIVVSFTTFPVRIKHAIYVADAMLRQTVKPDQVILVLASDEIESEGQLPDDYINLQRRGLKIVFTENLKQHKKYHYAMMNFPQSIIITVDDDVFYSKDLIKTLINSYKRYPNAVSAMRTHRVLIKENKLLPYYEWEFNSVYTNKPTFELFHTGVGGVLYPPGSLYKDFGDCEKMKQLSSTSEDIWMNTMRLLNNTPVVRATDKAWKSKTIEGSQEVSVDAMSRSGGLKDIVIQRCFDHYKISPQQLVKGLQETTIMGQGL